MYSAVFPSSLYRQKTGLSIFGLVVPDFAIDFPLSKRPYATLIRNVVGESRLTIPIASLCANTSISHSPAHMVLRTTGSRAKERQIERNLLQWTGHWHMRCWRKGAIAPIMSMPTSYRCLGFDALQKLMQPWFRYRLHWLDPSICLAIN